MEDGVGCLLGILFLIGVATLQEILREALDGNLKPLLVVLTILFLVVVVIIVSNYITKKERRKRKEKKKRKILLIKPQKGWVCTPEELFKNEYISFTRLKCYYECPKKFEILYLKKIDFEDKNKTRSLSLIRGKLIHKIIELYIQENINTFPQCLKNNNTIEHLLNLYERAKAIVACECDLSHIEKINQNKLLPYLRNFVYLNREEELLKRLQERNLSDDNLTRTYPEFIINTDIKGYKFKGIIDRLDIYEKHLVVIDYKTMSKKEYNKFISWKKFHLDQLDFYGYLLKSNLNNPDNFKIYTEYQFLKSKEVSINGLYWRFEEFLWEFIENIVLTENFEPKISSKCRYCIVNKICDLSE